MTGCQHQPWRALLWQVRGGPGTCLLNLYPRYLIQLAKHGPCARDLDESCILSPSQTWSCNSCLGGPG